jgi:DNA invertase Pin-like site-specific DNA recombinase
MIWYEDSELKGRHRELVKAGMERARKLGKRIGRPPVTERDGFVERFREVVERIGPGGLSRRQAARELDIGLATLKRLLDAGEPPAVLTKTPLRTLLPSVAGRYMPQNEFTDIIAQR